MKNEIIYNSKQKIGDITNIYTIHLNEKGIFWTCFVFYDNVENIEQLNLKKMIDDNRFEYSNNIKNEKSTYNFLRKKNLIYKIREYKLNKIIN